MSEIPGPAPEHPPAEKPDFKRELDHVAGDIEMYTQPTAGGEYDVEALNDYLDDMLDRFDLDSPEKLQGLVNDFAAENGISRLEDPDNPELILLADDEPAAADKHTQINALNQLTVRSHERAEAASLTDVVEPTPKSAESDPEPAPAVPGAAVEPFTPYPEVLAGIHKKRVRLREEFNSTEDPAELKRIADEMARQAEAVERAYPRIPEGATASDVESINSVRSAVGLEPLAEAVAAAAESRTDSEPTDPDASTPDGAGEPADPDGTEPPAEGSELPAPRDPGDVTLSDEAGAAGANMARERAEQRVKGLSSAGNRLGKVTAAATKMPLVPGLIDKAAGKVRGGRTAAERVMAEGERVARLDELEANYIDAARADAEKIRDGEGSDVEKASQLAELVYKLQCQRIDQDQKAAEERRGNGKLGKVGKFFKTIKENRKMRMGVNAALAVVGVAVVASGGGAIALSAVGLAKAGMRAVGGYATGELIHDGIESRRAKKRNEELKGQDLADAEGRAETGAAIDSPVRSQEIKGDIDERRRELYAQGVDRLRANLLDAEGHLVESHLALIEQEIKQHLAAEREQLQNDRRTIRARRIAGITGAAVGVFGGPILGAVADKVGLDSAAEWVGDKLGVGPDAPESPSTPEAIDTSKGAFGTFEEYDVKDLSEYGNNGVAVDNVNPGETPEQFARKHLEHMNGWSQFSAQDQAAKVEHFANQLKSGGWEDGQRVRWTGGMIEGAYEYQPSAPAVPDAGVDATANTDASVDAAPTAGGGAEAASSTEGPEWTGADSYQANDTRQSYAERQLSQINGWNTFDQGERSAKVQHFINQLTNKGAWPGEEGGPVRWNRSEIMNSFNYQG